MAGLITALTRNYEEGDRLFRQRARMYVVVVLIIALLTLINVGLELVIGAADPGSLAGSGILLLVYILSLLIMRAGRYEFAVTLFLVFTVIGIALTVITLQELHVDTAYRMAAGLLLPLISASVIAVRYYQVILTGALAIAVHLFFHFQFLVPAVGAEAATDNLGSTLVYLLVATVFVLAAVWMTGRLVRTAEEHAEASDAQLRNLSSLVATSQEGFQVGSSVQSEIAAVRRSIEHVEGTMRNLRDRMQELAGRHDAIRDANKSVADATGTVRQVVLEQNSATEESSASIAQMASSIRNIDEVAKSKKSLADGLARTAQEGQTQMDESVEAIATLADKISEISDVVAVIEGISEQTSLLSMNAAIEAAHAGEHGKGFAVVAEEIRKLSENTSENTHQIADTISTIVEQIRHTRETNSEAGGYFQRITKEVFDVRDAFEEMIAGLGELTTGTQEMDKAVRSLVDGSRTVESSIGGVDEKIKTSNQDVEQLHSYSSELLEWVQRAVSELERIEASSNKLEGIGRENVEQLRHFEERLNRITSGTETESASPAPERTETGEAPGPAPDQESETADGDDDEETGISLV